MSIFRLKTKRERRLPLFLTCGSDGAIVSDPTLPYPTCKALTGSIGDLLLDGVTFAEEYHAANETSGTLTCAYDEVAGDVVLEVAVPKCLPVACSLDDPSTGVSHECRNIPCRRVNQSAMHKRSIQHIRKCSALTL